MKKFQDQIPIICKGIETVLALIVFIALFLSAYNLLFKTDLLFGLVSGEAKFSELLEAVFSLVIGIEFIEMLCRPDSATVLEVLIFLVARHLIVETPSPVGIFISVIAVCILCIVRRFLHITKLRTQALEEHYAEHEKEMAEKEKKEKAAEKAAH